LITARMTRSPSPRRRAEGVTPMPPIHARAPRRPSSATATGAPSSSATRDSERSRSNDDSMKRIEASSMCMGTS
jgi:hypothetical protein